MDPRPQDVYDEIARRGAITKDKLPIIEELVRRGAITKDKLPIIEELARRNALRLSTLVKSSGEAKGEPSPREPLRTWRGLKVVGPTEVNLSNAMAPHRRAAQARQKEREASRRAGKADPVIARALARRKAEDKATGDAMTPTERDAYTLQTPPAHPLAALQRMQGIGSKAAAAAADMDAPPALRFLTSAAAIPLDIALDPLNIPLSITGLPLIGALSKAQQAIVHKVLGAAFGLPMAAEGVQTLTGDGDVYDKVRGVSGLLAGGLMGGLPWLGRAGRLPQVPEKPPSVAPDRASDSKPRVMEVQPPPDAVTEQQAPRPAAAASEGPVAPRRSDENPTVTKPPPEVTAPEPQTVTPTHTIDGTPVVKAGPRYRMVNPDGTLGPAVVRGRKALEPYKPPVEAEPTVAPVEAAPLSREVKSEQPQAIPEAAGPVRAEVRPVEGAQPAEVEKQPQAIPQATGAPRAVEQPARAGEVDMVKQDVATTPSEAVRPSVEGLAQAHDVYDAPVSSLTVDPERFQYKVEGVGKEGETATLKNVQTWDPNMAGTVLVWRDPVDGNTYVVNGHHRVGLAKRLGVQTVRVKFLDVPTAQDARAYGALTNIAEGHGTAIDAAKFFRDSGGGPEYLTERGVSTRSPLVREGLKLAGLEEGLWRGVTLGQIDPQVAAEVGGSGLKAQDQRIVWNAMKKEMDAGREVTPTFARNLVAAAKNAPRETVKTTGLFGDEEFDQSSLVEVARVTTWLQKQLASVRGKFRSVSKQETADMLATADNRINVEGNAGIAQDVSDVLGVFNALKDKTGPVKDIINEAARRLAQGRSDRDVYGYAWDALGDAIHTEVPTIPADALRNVGAGYRGRGGSTQAGLFDDAGFDAPSEPSGGPVSAKTRAQEPVARPSPISETTGKMGSSTRQWRAGRNVGSVTFASDIQRELYDTGAAWRKLGMPTSKEAASLTYEARRQVVDDRMRHVGQVLGLTDDEVVRLATRVYDDVRAQMKGIKDGEARTVADHVGIPAKGGGQGAVQEQSPAAMGAHREGQEGAGRAGEGRRVGRGEQGQGPARAQEAAPVQGAKGEVAPPPMAARAKEAPKPETTSGEALPQAAPPVKPPPRKRPPRQAGFIDLGVPIGRRKSPPDVRIQMPDAPKGVGITDDARSPLDRMMYDAHGRLIRLQGAFSKMLPEETAARVNRIARRYESDYADMVADWTNRTSHVVALLQERAKATRTKLSRAFSDFIDIVEMRRDDPDRVPADPTLRQALEEHDALTQSWLEALQTLHPDMNGITEIGYFRHLFLGRFVLKNANGNVVGSGRTYGDLLAQAAAILKADPSAELHADWFALRGDPTLRVSTRRFWKIVGDTAAGLGEQMGSISADDLRAEVQAAMRGEIGMKESRQKWLGTLMERTGAEGFSRAYPEVMELTAVQTARHIALTKLNKRIVPEIETLRRDGRQAQADFLEDWLTGQWGTPAADEIWLGNRLQGTAVGNFLERRYGLPPVYVLRTVLDGLKTVTFYATVPYKLPTSAANGIQPYITLADVASPREISAATVRVLTSKALRNELARAGVFGGATKLTSDAGMTVSSRMSRTPMGFVSDLNRAVGYVIGRDHARAALPRATAAELREWGRMGAEKAEFNSSVLNAPALFRGARTKTTMLQFKSFWAKMVEELATSLEPQAGERGRRVSRQGVGRLAKKTVPAAVFGGAKALAPVGIAGATLYAGIKELGRSRGLDDEDAETAAKVLTYGVPGLADVDMSAQMSVTDFLNYGGDTVQEKVGNFVIGPSGSSVVALVSFINAGIAWARSADDEDTRTKRVKEIRAALQKISPYVKQAWMLAEQRSGETTTSVMGKEQEVTPRERTVLTLGGTPPAITRVYEGEPVQQSTPLDFETRRRSRRPRRGLF